MNGEGVARQGRIDTEERFGVRVIGGPHVPPLGVPTAASRSMSAKCSRPSGVSLSPQASRIAPDGSMPQASGPYLDRTTAKRSVNGSATGPFLPMGVLRSPDR